jgi:hypothetical protein
MSESTAVKGTFVLFKNVKREGDHPRKPIYSGSIELPDGTKFDLAGWINEGKVGSKIEGQKYIKGEVTDPWVPTPRVESPAPSSEQKPEHPVHGADDIPW